jgi:hypothetical protein
MEILKMRKLLIFAMGIALLLGLALPTPQLKAQVYGDFDMVTLAEGSPYVELQDATVIDPYDFKMYPQWETDRNDGYYRVNIGFDYKFNGEIYNQVYICVNGFVTFANPPYIRAKYPPALFDESSSYPINVIAPFWGDHFLRTNQDNAGKPPFPDENHYMPSEISYKTENDVFTVQWKNLNVNNPAITSSVANFQLKLYKSEDPLSNQGDIEFCYGTTRGNLETDEQVVVVEGASVGIKGEFDDFMNGLMFNNTSYEQRKNKRLNYQWPPSTGTDKRILFRALNTYDLDDWWGDGDVDFSKGVGRKHEGMKQNRFVTVNDARLIMRSVVNQLPLDSARGRSAYHGDVNHNGRYYYSLVGQDESGEAIYERKDIYWRDEFVGDNLPRDINTIKKVFFQANEFDAAMILMYMGCKVPHLPWIHDIIINTGKVGAYAEFDEALTLGTPVEVSENVYKMPVFSAYDIDGPLGLKFKVNAKIEELVASQDDADVLVEFNNDLVVVSGVGQFSTEKPLFYITFNSSDEAITLSEIRMNDRNYDDIGFNLLTVDNNEPVFEVMSQNYPNPVVNSTNIMLNIQQEGNYTLTVFDALGNKVNILMSDYLFAGEQLNVEWDGTDANGNKVQSGVYVYKLTGNNTTVSRKMIVNK